MNRNVRTVAAALGVTTISILRILRPFISSKHDLLYHWSGSTAWLFIPALLDIAIFWAALVALLFAAERNTQLRSMTWSAILCFGPFVALENVIVVSGHDLPYALDLTLFAGACCLYLFLTFWWWPRHQPALNTAVTRTSKVFAFIAVSGFGILCQTTWCGWQARWLNTQSPRPPAAITAAAKPPVIWILLDELSYQQLYEDRYPGLALPAFDRLAAQSSVFTHVVPAGFRTKYVLPSLFNGVPADDLHVNAAGRLTALHEPNTTQWHRFDQHDTVFQDALSAGYNTALSGWYNPYCRILPDVLNQCFWIFHNETPHGNRTARNWLKAMTRPFQELTESAETHRLLHITPDLQLHIADYQQLYTAGDQLLNDPAGKFIFLHMPIPHPEGIWNRATNQFATRPMSYIDNLALADKYIAHVEALLTANGQWDSATIVIMGDHSWRTSGMWTSSSVWTPEDQKASHGAQFDDRPAYIIKFPNQKQGTRIDTPFPAVDTRLLIDSLLRQQLHSPSELATWVAAHPPH